MAVGVGEIVGVKVGVVTVPLSVMDFARPVFQYNKKILELIDVLDGEYLNKIQRDTFEPSVYGRSLLVRQGVDAEPLWIINGLVAPTVEKNIELMVRDCDPILRIVTSEVISVLTGTFPKLI